MIGDRLRDWQLALSLRGVRIRGLQVAIACYVGAGRLEDAQRVVADCLRLSPDWRRDRDAKSGPRSPEVRMKFREAFLRAGLPE